MKRTQIQLSENDFDALRKIAAEKKRSIADCIREGIALFLQKSTRQPGDFSCVAGRFHPVPDDRLKSHDLWWSQSIGKRRD